MTNQFARQNFLGEGDFGEFYFGNFSENSYNGIVAVKRLNTMALGGTLEFQKQINLLSAYHHANIISLVGYCDEQDEKILVLELMRTSLYDYLYTHQDHTPRLTVEQRLEICIGVAEGLSILHSGTHSNVIHGDLSTEHILLDPNLVAKISGFSLSKVLAAGQSSSQELMKSISLCECQPFQ